MFRESISETKLTSPAADALFKDKITGDAFNNDKTFIATLRALLASRLEEGQSLHLKIAKITCGDDVKSQSPEDAMATVRSNVSPFEPNVFTIVNFSGRQENAEAMLNNIASRMERDSAMKPVEIANAWLKRNKIAAYAYSNAEGNCATVFVSMMDTTRFHVMQAIIRHCMPWLFEKHPLEKGSVESEIIRALIEDTPEHYVELIAQVASQYDFRSPMIREKLHGFEARHFEQVYRSTEQQIQTLQREIRELFQKAGEKNRKVRDLQIQNFGAKVLGEQQNADELMEYFLTNKNLELVSADDDGFTFIYFGGFMDMWDEDSAERAINNHGSEIYRTMDHVTKDDMEKLYRAVFIDQKLFIKMCGAYQIRTSGDSSPLQHYTFPAEYKGYMPNPHGDGYRCIGGHGQYINEAVNSGNYVMAVEQCCAAARNLNFTDGAVMRYFADHLFAKDAGRWIQLPDGRSVTAIDAVKYLKEEK